MSITSFMYTGISGMRSHSDAMSVISDNIANVNTVGYKSSRANFADILGGTLGGDRVGGGSRIGNVQRVFTEGSLLGTGNATDLALRGDGFFMVADTGNGNATPYFTRAGQFNLDANGFLVNPQGLRVQGFSPDTQGNVGSVVGDIRVDAGTLPPSATSRVAIDANLDASQPTDATPFDIDDPSATSDYSTSVTVYDSVGRSHQLELFFKKMGDSPAQWELHVATPGDALDPATGTARSIVGQGTLTFGPDGSLQDNTLAALTIPWSGANPGAVEFDLGTPISAGGTGVDGITGYAGASATSFIQQDGNSTGELGGIQVDADGTVLGMYTNGEARALGQIAVARFTATSGLTRAGEGLFSATRSSGDPLISAAGAGGAGSVIAGNLESSNVDLATEFVTMIAVQRGFQGNSRTISTADEMLSEVVSLKR